MMSYLIGNIARESIIGMGQSVKLRLLFPLREALSSTFVNETSWLT